MAERADFIIVGAGVAGLGVAAHLAAEARVIVLEAERAPCLHSTGRSAAVFIKSYGPPGVRAISAAAEGFFEAPPEGFAAAPLLTPRGILYLDYRGGALDALMAGNPGVKPIDIAEAVAMAPALRPERIVFAAHEEDARDIDVDLLTSGFRRMIAGGGGRIVTDAEVGALTRAGGLWRAETKAGAFEAPVVVNAAGAWAGRLGEMAGAEPIGLTPKRRTAMMVAEPAGFTGRAAPITIDIDEEFYLKPDAGRLLISPADETPSAPCDAQPEELDIAICVDRITTAFDLDIRRIETKWAGLRSFVRDKEPVIGFSAARPGFFWLAGQGGYGIQTSPAASALAAALVRGLPAPAPILDQGFDPALVSPVRLGAPS